MDKIYSTLVLICSGIILGICLFILDIPMTFENMIYLFFGLFILIFSFYIIRLFYITKKFKKYLNEPDYSLDEVEKKINKMHNSGFKISLLINLSVAYSIKKNYESALRVLDHIDISKANSRIKVIYYNNLATFLLKKGDIIKASAILKDQRDLFNKYLDNILLAPSLLETIEQIESFSKDNEKNSHYNL